VQEARAFFTDPKVLKHVSPLIYLTCATLALFIHVDFLSVVATQVAPTHSLIVWLSVPGAMIYFLYLTQMPPGALEKRPIGRSAVEELMAEVDSEECPVSSKKLKRLCLETWVMKGLRTKYCSVSHQCIEEFDHFCGWLGTPVGKGNHRGFMFMCFFELWAQIVHCLLLIRVGIAEAGRVSMEENPTAASEPGLMGGVMFLLSNHGLSFFVLIAHFVTIPWVICLTSYHVRLIAKNLTTNEVMNMYRYEHFWVVSGENNQRTFHNPFDKGSAWLNILDFFWYRQRAFIGNAYRAVPLQDIDDEE